MASYPGCLQRLVFLVGGFFLRLIDAVVPHLHLRKDISEAESVPEHSRKKLSKTAFFFLLLPFTIFQKVWQSE